MPQPWRVHLRWAPSTSAPGWIETLVAANHVVVMPTTCDGVDFVITNDPDFADEETRRRQPFGPSLIVFGPALSAPLRRDSFWLPESATAETVCAILELVAHIRTLRAALDETQADLDRWRTAALTDSVTGLLSRRGWEEWLATSSREIPAASWGVAVLDLDDFKRVNDTRGLPQGDAALTAVGQTLARIAAPGDVVARWGGDEFVIALPSANRREVARRVESFRRALGEIALASDLQPLTASAGWSWHPSDDESSVADLFSEAEAALRTAKKLGRNQLFPKT